MTTITRPLHVPARWHVSAVAVGVVLLAGLVVGALAWAHQLDVGLLATGLGDVVPWGLTMVALTFFAGVSAGAVGLASAAVLLRVSALSAAVRPALVVSAAAALTALLASVVDLARPERVLNLVLHPNWEAPMVWSLLGLVVGLVLALVLLAATARRPLDSPAARVLAGLGVLVALGMPSLTAWVFALQVGRPVWNDSLVPPTMVAFAAAGGGAVATLVTLSRPGGAEPLSERARGLLALLVGVPLVLSLLLVGSGYVTALGSGPQEQAAVDLLLPGGPWSWLFWTQWLLALLALGLLAVSRRRSSPVALGTAAAAAVATALAYYLTLIPVGLAEPPVSLTPGVPTGRAPLDGAAFERTVTYQPTWTEYGLVVGLVAVFATIVAVALVAAHRRGAHS